MSNWVQELYTLQQENERLKEERNSNAFGMFNMDMVEKLKRIEELARTLGNQGDVKTRLDDKEVKQLLNIDNDLLTNEDILRKSILKVIEEE